MKKWVWLWANLLLFLRAEAFPAEDVWDSSDVGVRIFMGGQAASSGPPGRRRPAATARQGRPGRWMELLKTNDFETWALKVFIHLNQKHPLEWLIDAQT